MKSEKNLTTQEEYTNAVKACVSLLEIITKKIKIHMKAQATDNKNWGYIGDLLHVKEELEEINTFLNQPYGFETK